MNKIGKHVVALHPRRDIESRWKWENSSHVVLLVDGITAESLRPEVSKFITDSALRQLSVHARAGTYKGKPFDNTHHVKTVFTCEDQVVMRGTADTSIFQK